MLHETAATRPELYFTPEELSERYIGKISIDTLAAWRREGRGPEFDRRDGRDLYPASGIAEWEAQPADDYWIEVWRWPEAATGAGSEPNAAEVTDPESFFTPRQLCERWEGRVAVKTLANWRCADIPRGPTFRRLGNRIYYALVDIEEFEHTTRFRSTREYETARD